MWQLHDATVTVERDPAGLKLSVIYVNSTSGGVRQLDWYSWGEVQYRAVGESAHSWRRSFLAPVWEREDTALLTSLALLLSQQLAGQPYSEALESLRQAELGSWWDL